MGANLSIQTGMIIPLYVARVLKSFAKKKPLDFFPKGRHRSSKNTLLCSESKAAKVNQSRLV